MNRDFETAAGSTQTLSNAVRVIGLAILLAGVAVGFKVIVVAWELFENQSKVVSLAQSMEQQCGINGFLRTYVGTLLPSDTQPAPARPANTVGSSIPPEVAAKLTQSLQGVDVVYFFAWAMTVTLLSVIARIASWAVIEGGRLAMSGDPGKDQVKELVRELIAETRRT